MNYDPAADKINRDAGVVSAQPVAAYEVRTIAAAPTAHNVAPQYHAQGRATAVRPMQNHWKDSICDWPNNLFPSCYCVCCCCYGMWLLAQSKQAVLRFIRFIMIIIYPYFFSILHSRSESWLFYVR